MPKAKVMSAADLADELGAERNRINIFLTRYAVDHADCRESTKNPRSDEPAYVYRVRDVWRPLVRYLERTKDRKRRSGR
jgi:hypothetical protein